MVVQVMAAGAQDAEAVVMGDIAAEMVVAQMVVVAMAMV